MIKLFRRFFSIKDLYYARNCRKHVFVHFEHPLQSLKNNAMNGI